MTPSVTCCSARYTSAGTPSESRRPASDAGAGGTGSANLATTGTPAITMTPRTATEAAVLLRRRTVRRVAAVPGGVTRLIPSARRSAKRASSWSSVSWSGTTHLLGRLELGGERRTGPVQPGLDSPLGDAFPFRDLGDGQ